MTTYQPFFFERTSVQGSQPTCALLLPSHSPFSASLSPTLSHSFSPLRPLLTRSFSSFHRPLKRRARSFFAGGHFGPSAVANMPLPKRAFLRSRGKRGEFLRMKNKRRGLRGTLSLLLPGNLSHTHRHTLLQPRPAALVGCGTSVRVLVFAVGGSRKAFLEAEFNSSTSAHNTQHTTHTHSSLSNDSTHPLPPLPATTTAQLRAITGSSETTLSLDMAGAKAEGGSSCVSLTRHHHTCSPDAAPSSAHTSSSPSSGSAQREYPPNALLFISFHPLLQCPLLR